MMKMFLIQCIGAVGYTTLSFSYFKKKKKDILLIEIISYLFFALHYFLLNGITGMICNIIESVSLAVIFFFDKYKLQNKVLFSLFFSVLLLSINIITYQNIYSFFPMIASIIVILSFLSNKENHIRIIGVIAALCWLIYAIVYQSYVSILFEVFTLANVFLSIYKNTGKKKIEMKKK